MLLIKAIYIYVALVATQNPLQEASSNHSGPALSLPFCCFLRPRLCHEHVRVDAAHWTPRTLFLAGGEYVEEAGGLGFGGFGFREFGFRTQ